MIIRDHSERIPTRPHTYIHFTPDGVPFYVGKGGANNPRAWEIGRNPHWDHKYAKEGGRKVMIACEWDTDDEALDHEVFLIATFRDMGYKLTNLTDGGEQQFPRLNLQIPLRKTKNPGLWLHICLRLKDNLPHFPGADRDNPQLNVQPLYRPTE